MVTAPEDEIPDAMVASFFSSESEPSTAPPEVGERATERVARYHPRNNEDRTKNILSSFLEFLPIEGELMLAEFIARTVDDKTLYCLSNHLLTSILIPSEIKYL